MNAPWFDLDAADPFAMDVRDEWFALGGVAINLAGEIVGVAENDQGVSRSFVLDNVFEVSPRFLLLPVSGLPEIRPGAMSMDINENGEIAVCASGAVVRYIPAIDGYMAVEVPVPGGGWIGLNDDGLIVRQEHVGGSTWSLSHIQFSDGTITTLEGYRLINCSNNWLCGERLGTKGKNDQPGGAIRIPILANGQLGADELIFETSRTSYTRDINDWGDAVFESGGRAYIYCSEINPDTIDPNDPNDTGDTGEPYGALSLDDLVTTEVNNQADVESWLESSAWIRMCRINNAGQISGNHNGVGRGFVLTPIAVEP